MSPAADRPKHELEASKRTFEKFNLVRLLRTCFGEGNGEKACILIDLPDPHEVEDFRLVRDEATGKSKGFAFVKYEEWRSAVLTVDNFNGMPLLGRTLRVDHARYKPPAKKAEEEEAESMEDKARRYQPGHAYDGQEIALTGFDLHQAATRRMLRA